ncbi:DUF4422 domain-containing protein [Flexilinea flocculi]|uniref:Lipopolysaccharide biosynthesis protein, LPS:glycosyltransferase n=1 Tax=Flexilinea flocculi TaxID=1678840 RepID=A0A0K8P9Y5_9CHLR|nr:DUF4422 domain-containing protein [Flexilinea flocculi]GAP39478.1 lipopolysaccharide biosynthesis protein, LPS:glycosyltransferase [Flexilinea flocculi]
MNFGLQIYSKRNIKAIKNSNLFDEKWYQDKYLYNSDQNPVLHFLEHGTEEGIDPSPNFSTKEYYLKNPDVKSLGMNALLHYELYGKSEGRELIQYSRLLKHTSYISINKDSKPYEKKESDKKTDIKIFVACKTESYVPENPLLFPIQTGTTLAEHRFKSMLHDDEGENISKKNESFCELTAQFWAWKNVSADYYGFFHNRRYLSFNNQLLYERKNVGIEFNSIDSYAIRSLKLFEEQMRSLIESYDIIVPKPFDWISSKELGINRTVERQYELCPEHHIDDLKCALDILKRLHPEYSSAANRYMNSSKGYYLNMYIMRKNIFFEYCEWLFPILEELYKTLDLSNRTEYSKRAIGFVAERFFGVFLTDLIEKKTEIRIHELQNSYFKSVSPPETNRPDYKKSDIKIFVSHRIDLESEIIDNPLYYPVRCGAVFDNKESEIPGDNTLENISEKRDTFCELTVQYWAWKNAEADYYGLCHYRRFQSFADKQFEETDIYKHVVEQQIDPEFIYRHNLNETAMRKVIEKYDVISLVPMDLNDLEKGLTVYKSLENNAYVYNMMGVDLFIKIFKETYPEYSEDIDEYFNGHIWRAFNCYILKKELFFDYSERLFNVLFQLEKKLDISKFNQEQKRLAGYMGECMFAIYYNHLQKLGKYRTKELQLVKVEHPQKRMHFKPAFQENNIAVVMASSDAYVPFLTVLLQSIIENMSPKNNYDFIIVSDGICDRNKDYLQRFIFSNRNLSIRFANAYNYIGGQNLYTRMHVTPTTYVRLAVPDILIGYKKAIYLDCDIVINTDIADLYNIDIEGYMIAAARDSVMAGWCNMPGHEQNKYNKEILGLKREFEYFNAGVLLINIDEFKARYTTDELFEIASSENWKWFDQDVLNMICEGKVKLLDQSWNFMAHLYDLPYQLSEFFAPITIYKDYLEARKAPKAIHYAGRFIPCFEPHVDLAHYFWHYARQTIYYEVILSAMIDNKLGSPHNSIDVHKGVDVVTPRKIADKILPIGTRRREFLKKILPKDSHRWNLCKQVYYIIFHPKYWLQNQ